MVKRIISFFIIFALIFEQSGFAQAGPQSLGMPGYLSGLPQVVDRFRPVHLRSISFSEPGKYRLLLDTGDAGDLPVDERQAAASKLMEYFQIGLRLPDSAFWVNLRPDAPDNIIDPLLEKTDIGKVLLEADLQLKKDLAGFTNPATVEGRKYWDRLYAKAETLFNGADCEIPAYFRPWIVPGEVIIGESESGAYIYKATLKVCLEEDWLSRRNLVGYHEGQSSSLSFSDQEQDDRVRQLNKYSSQLIKELILPKLAREINASKRYAGLRQVYYSLILAQWAKQRLAFSGERLVDKRERMAVSGERVAVSKESVAVSGERLVAVDNRDLTGLVSQKPWSKDDYFRLYRKSVAEGEYHSQEQSKISNSVIIRQYTSGGMNFDGGGKVQYFNADVSKIVTAAMPDFLVSVTLNAKEAGDGGKVQDRHREKGDGGKSGLPVVSSDVIRVVHDFVAEQPLKPPNLYHGNVGEFEKRCDAYLRNLPVDLSPEYLNRLIEVYGGDQEFNKTIRGVSSGNLLASIVLEVLNNAGDSVNTYEENKYIAENGLAGLKDGESKTQSTLNYLKANLAVVWPDGYPGGCITVSFSLEKKDGWDVLQICIRDNGAGINAADTERKKAVALYSGGAGRALPLIDKILSVTGLSRPVVVKIGEQGAEVILSVPLCYLYLWDRKESMRRYGRNLGAKDGGIVGKVQRLSAPRKAEPVYYTRGDLENAIRKVLGTPYSGEMIPEYEALIATGKYVFASYAPYLSGAGLRTAEVFSDLADSISMPHADWERVHEKLVSVAESIPRITGGWDDMHLELFEEVFPGMSKEEISMFCSLSLENPNYNDRPRESDRLVSIVLTQGCSNQCLFCGLRRDDISNFGSQMPFPVAVKLMERVAGYVDTIMPYYDSEPLDYLDPVMGATLKDIADAARLAGVKDISVITHGSNRNKDSAAVLKAFAGKYRFALSLHTMHTDVLKYAKDYVSGGVDSDKLVQKRRDIVDKYVAKFTPLIETIADMNRDNWGRGKVHINSYRTISDELAAITANEEADWEDVRRAQEILDIMESVQNDVVKKLLSLKIDYDKVPMKRIGIRLVGNSINFLRELGVPPEVIARIQKELDIAPIGSDLQSIILPDGSMQIAVGQSADFVIPTVREAFPSSSSPEFRLFLRYLKAVLMRGCGANVPHTADIMDRNLVETIIRGNKDIERELEITGKSRDSVVLRLLHSDVMFKLLSLGFPDAKAQLLGLGDGDISDEDAERIYGLVSELPFNPTAGFCALIGEGRTSETMDVFYSFAPSWTADTSPVKQYHNIKSSLQAFRIGRDKKDGGAEIPEDVLTPGGIDFRAAGKGSVLVPAGKEALLRNISSGKVLADPAAEWGLIEAEVRSSAMPYGRIINFYAACCGRDDLEEYRLKVISLVLSSLRYEEEANVPTSGEGVDIIKLIS